jgi:RAB protein geranylgeranyltransferase component A
VFTSKLLSPMDKRRLMKFLQTAMDYATAEALKQEQEDEDTVDDLQSWNERHLNQGRSLQRPQNKAVANTDLQQLQDLCRSDSNSQFEAYLRENQKLSPALTNLVRYALALEAGDTASSTTTGMKQLCAHMLALGRFGATAFLVPMYGSGELAQSFCRSAAVYGATYLLRRAPTGIVVDNANVVQGVWLNGPQAEEAAATVTKCISCAHVVVPDGALVRSPQARATGQRVLRRISILCGKPILNDEEHQQQQRHVVILPPGTVPNQTSTIHGLFLDEAVNVAPHVPGGCTVVHLTTTVDAGDNNNVDITVLEEAQKVILRRCRGKDGDAGAVAEIFHVSFSYDLLVSTGDTKIDGLHEIRRARPGLSADSAFEQAAEIFAEICPGQEFLKLSKEMGDAVKASLGENALDEEDEEKMVLESAVGMIDPPLPPSP